MAKRPNQFERMDCMAGRPISKWTPKRIEEEAVALEKWSKLKSSLTINGFSIDRPEPYSKQQMYKLAHKSKALSDSIVRAKQRIAHRREMGGLKGELDSSLVRTGLTFYDSEFKEHTLEMKRKEAEAAAKAFSAEEIKKAFAKSSDADA